MDVHCSSCGEPWDVYHLRHEAIFETDLSHEEAEAWGGLTPAIRLSDHYRHPRLSRVRSASLHKAASMGASKHISTQA